MYWTEKEEISRSKNLKEKKSNGLKFWNKEPVRQFCEGTLIQGPV